MCKEIHFAVHGMKDRRQERTAIKVEFPSDLHGGQQWAAVNVGQPVNQPRPPLIAVLL
jgi:hypothetical protein